MDKFTEKAASMAVFICSCRGEASKSGCPRLAAVAQALRECAAEAKAQECASLNSYYQDLLRPGDSIGRDELLARLSMLSQPWLRPAPATGEGK